MSLNYHPIPIHGLNVSHLYASQLSPKSHSWVKRITSLCTTQIPLMDEMHHLFMSFSYHLNLIHGLNISHLYICQLPPRSLTWVNFFFFFLKTFSRLRHIGICNQHPIVLLIDPHLVDNVVNIMSVTITFPGRFYGTHFRLDQPSAQANFIFSIHPAALMKI